MVRGKASKHKLVYRDCMLSMSYLLREYVPKLSSLGENEINFWERERERERESKLKLFYREKGSNNNKN